MSQSDVLIVGAGPTGLVLALWLTKQSVKVRIIDETAEPGTTSRALAVHARTLELYQQLVTLTRRAAVMEAQVDVLAGKSKVLTRFRDSIAEHAALLSQLAEGGAASQAADADGRPAFTRALLGAQEDLRREIARAMHDGPAQSLTNIVLQAQIGGAAREG